MNINQLLKKITENYKNLEIKLPETKKEYNKTYWEKFISEIYEKENIKIKENNFILKKETALVFGKGLEETAIIFPENEEIKILFSIDNKNEFVFETEKFSFTYTKEEFIFIKKGQKTIENFIITSSPEKANEMLQFGMKKIKILFSNAGILTDILFEKFISEPKSFEIFLEKLWNDMSEEFLLKYNPIKEEENKTELVRFVTTW